MDVDKKPVVLKSFVVDKEAVSDAATPGCQSALVSMEYALKRHLERCDLDITTKRAYVSSFDGDTPPASPASEAHQTPRDSPRDPCDSCVLRPTGTGNSILALCLLSTTSSASPTPCSCPPSMDVWSGGTTIAPSGLQRVAHSVPPNYVSGWSSSDSELMGAAQPAVRDAHHPAPVSVLGDQCTIECDGKSYIDLGASHTTRQRSSAYRYQRFTVLHATLLKLGRHRRMNDARLCKSVLLYNTMRALERELAQEGVTLAAAFNPHQTDAYINQCVLDPPPFLSQQPHALVHASTPGVGLTDVVSDWNCCSSPVVTAPSIVHPSSCSSSSSSTTVGAIGLHSVYCQPPADQLARASNHSSIHHEGQQHTQYSATLSSGHSSCTNSSASNNPSVTADINWCSVLSISNEPDVMLLAPSTYPSLHCPSLPDTVNSWSSLSSIQICPTSADCLTLSHHSNPCESTTLISL